MKYIEGHHLYKEHHLSKTTLVLPVVSATLNVRDTATESTKPDMTKACKSLVTSVRSSSVKFEEKNISIRSVGVGLKTKKLVVVYNLFHSIHELIGMFVFTSP